MIFVDLIPICILYVQPNYYFFKLNCCLSYLHGTKLRFFFILGNAFFIETDSSTKSLCTTMIQKIHICVCSLLDHNLNKYANRFCCLYSQSDVLILLHISNHVAHGMDFDTLTCVKQCFVSDPALLM